MIHEYEREPDARMDFSLLGLYKANAELKS